MSKEMIVKLNADRVKINGCEYVQDLVRCGECANRPHCNLGIAEHGPNGFCSLAAESETNERTNHQTM